MKPIATDFLPLHPLELRILLAVIDAPSYRHLAYRPGVPIVRALDVSG